MTQYDNLNVKLSNSQLHKLSQTLFQYLLNPAEVVKKIEKKKEKNTLQVLLQEQFLPLKKYEFRNNARK